ncbi:MAG: hypothetical protein WCX65_17660 [bacterium]
MHSKFRVLYLTFVLFLATNIAVISAPAKQAKKPAPAKAAAPAKAPADADARALLSKLVANVKSLDSYKFKAYLEGYDTFSKDRQKDIAGGYKNLAEKTGTDVKIAEKPQMKRGLYEAKFMKPYLTQMKIIKSDFVPKILLGTIITYRSDKDPDVWWAKPKISPVAIKRSIVKDDSAGATTMNWNKIMIQMIYYGSNADLSLQPEVDFDGHKCYVLRFSFDWTKRPVWNHKQPPIKDFGMPVQINDIIWGEMIKIEKQKFSSIDYFIDKERMVPLKIEESIDGEFFWRTMFKDVEIGGLKESDF